LDWQIDYRCHHCDEFDSLLLLKNDFIPLNQKLLYLLLIVNNLVVDILKLAWNGVDLMSAYTQNLIKQRVILIGVLQNDVPLAHLHEFPIAWNYSNFFVL